MKKTEYAPPVNFIRNIVREDIAANKHAGKVVTRFPPEPNGYLHIGHAKSVWLNFGIAREFGSGHCNLRFDDTNPEREEAEFGRAIIKDLHWLGYREKSIRHTSDYFEQLFDYAVALIKKDKAYVCELDSEQIREQRGTLTEAGRESPYRNRSIEENISLFNRMRAGDYEDGECVLRAKIAMDAANINLRDPVIYRVRHVRHHRTGERWCIYPSYDFSHCISDSLEGITHSICTLEFEDHRPLYDWFLDALNIHHPRQIEFARLELSHTITSKRKLKTLIDSGAVDGWDDPRLLTIAGMRRRGIPAAAIRTFCECIGVTKKNSLIEIELLETCIRDALNPIAPRAMAVLDPLKVVITNYADDKTEMIDAVNNPRRPSDIRPLPFSREIYIERDDFMENPPGKFFRLAPQREVRLKYAYYITCEEVVKDAGEVVELRCRYDPKSRGGGSPDGRKVKGTIHWVSAAHAVKAEVRLYERLFAEHNPALCEEFEDALNPSSKVVVKNAMLEPGLGEMQAQRAYQFERLGYFIADSNSGQSLVINRIITLYDSWQKIKRKMAPQ